MLKAIPISQTHISRQIDSDRLTISRNIAPIGDEVTFSEQIKKYLLSKSEILNANFSILIFVYKNDPLNYTFSTWTIGHVHFKCVNF
jgi:hypothetical protein